MEEWRDIQGYEGLYKVSRHGEIKSKTGRYKKAVKKNGYLLISLCKNGVHKCYLVHRLVAIAFIPNPYNYPVIDHINGIKDDNRVENLRWCTQLENMRNPNTINNSKGIRLNNEHLSKPVIQLTKNKIFIKEYPSIREASRKTGISHGGIGDACRGIWNTAGGYCWCYKNENKNIKIN